MDPHRRQPLLIAVVLVLIAVMIVFVFPPATNDSERAFRLIVVGAAIAAAILKWRRSRRDRL